MTGALHEDGLADTADGLAGHNAEESIRIMRDSRSGGYGVLAMIFSVGLRATALAAIADPLAVVLAMTAVGAASRAAMPAVMLALPRATSTGLGAAAGKPAAADTFFGIAIAALLALALLGPGGRSPSLPPPLSPPWLSPSLRGAGWAATPAIFLARCSNRRR